MRVIAATSPGPAGRISALLIVRRMPQKKTPQGGPGAFQQTLLPRSATVAEEPKQHEEEVDEVQIEPQRAHHRLAAGDGAVVHRAVHLLDVLRVVGGEPDKDEHADDRDDPAEPARMQEDIDQAGDDGADQAHEQERSEEHTSELQSLAY